MIDLPLSPLFPVSSLALSPAREEFPDEQVLLPQVPDLPLVLTSSLQIFIVPTEKHLFVQGFKPAEYEGLPPSLLRGCLVVRVLKATKLKSLSLAFKGTQRTEWPEGIPPKKSVYAEINDLVSHTWPFYQSETHPPDCGADFFRPSGRSGRLEDITHLSLGDSQPRTLSPANNVAVHELSTLFAANLIKRATSPLAPSASTNLTPDNSMADLTTVLSSLSVAAAGESTKPGYFAPGDYIYNFEHPLPALTPESVHVNFGKVSYYLEATAIRMGTFKANLTGRLPVEVVRIPSENSVEENEPILIERDWEDQLRYEIVVGSKTVVLGTYVPLAFKFIPLWGKVALHRIRVYLTETCNYYCLNKAVHRVEPTRKFLLLEHKAAKNKSLLSKSGGVEGVEDEVDDEVLPRELEFQLFVPSTMNKKCNFCIHLNTSIENIKCDHWIKISLRISKQDPDNPEKRKHYEILIDSPIHLCSPLAAHCNTLLPAYQIEEPEFLPRYTENSPPMSPGVTAVHGGHPVGHLIFSALSGFGLGPSSPVATPEILRSATPIEFQHISSAQNNDNPIERDHDMHLEANLFQPDDALVLDVLASPQARPAASPQVRPTSVARRLSVNPPPFEALATGVTEGTLPPAYERNDPALSVSPLRRASSEASRRSTTSKGSGGSAGSGSSIQKPTILVHAPSLNIKNLLGQQLNRKSSLSERRERDSSDTRLSKEEPRDEPAKSPRPAPDLEATDIAGDDSHRLGSTGRFSRKSSTSLATSLTELDDFALDQTLPLLSSTTSNSMLARPLFDSGRRPSVLGSSSMVDLVDEAVFGDDYHVTGSLFQLRNPRLTKHYQEPDETEPTRKRDDTITNNPRKSFGVIPLCDLPRLNRSLTESSLKSQMTINELADTDKMHDAYISPDTQAVISK